MEIENKPISEEGAAQPQPAQMPAAAPMPEQPVMPAAEMQPMQGQMPEAAEVERMQMPMQPIDLSGQQEMPIQMSAPETGGKKKMYIIIGVVIAGLLAGVVAFFIWRSMSAPAPETAAIPEQQVQQPAQPMTAPTTTEQVVVPVAPEPDSITVIEQDLSAFNATSIDTELQGGLAEITKSL